MSEYRKLPRRVREWFRSRAQMAAEVDEEIAFHLEMRAAKLAAQGLAPAAALAQAKREFGDAASLRQDLLRHEVRRDRRLRVGAWLEDLHQDVRFALRSFARAPGFAAVALGTLVLGIGASVSIFTVVNSVLLRPLPYDEPERLVHVWPGHNYNMALAEAVAGSAPSLAAWTGLSFWGLTLTGAGDAVELATQVVDAGFFDVFAVRPQLGRAFTTAERDPSRSGVVLISDELWRTRFGADRSIIGRQIRVDGYGHRTREVIGVMPRGFVPPLADGAGQVALWVPLHVPPGRSITTDSTWYVNQVIARLAPGATLERAGAEVAVALQRARAASGNRLSEEAVRAPGAVSLHASLVGATSRSLWVLLGAVAMVLLLVCANLANLLLARGDRRRPELAARAALGATRPRIVRELLTESAVLALLGGAGGVLFARLVLDALQVAEASGLPRRGELAMDGHVLGFALAVSTLALALFALLPALRITSGNLRPALGSGRRAHGLTRGGRRLGSLLIGAEVALAMVLVTGAGLLLQSFRAVRSIDPGLDTGDVLAVAIAPSPAEYDGDRALQLHAEILERVRALPGVTTAGAIHLLPFTANNWTFPYLAEGHEPPANGPLPSANFRVVTPGYFDAVDVPLLAGRTFDASDAGGPDVVIINRRLAELLWPGRDAVGRELRLFGSIPLRVVGVVGDVRQHTLDAEPEPEMYRPFGQWTLSSMVIMVETRGDPAALADPVRAAIAAIDRDIPVVQARPLHEILGESLAQRRFFSSVLTFFGLLALLLGGVGVYGVMSYAVSARMPEFGVRIALGATHGRVLRDALAAGLAPVIAGGLTGTLLSFQASRLLESLLFEVRPREPLVLLAAAVLLAAVATLATWAPTRRVRAAEPMAVLNGP